MLTIGNAIVDVLAHTEEDFLVREGLVKGSMRLIDGKEADRLFEHMGTAQLISGGCAGNTAAGVASFGGRAAFIGKVADDELGRFFRHDMQALGIHFPTAPLTDGTPTARSMILITPDSERTMNTFLAACQELTPDDIDRADRGRRGDHLSRRLSLGSAEGEGSVPHRRADSRTAPERKVAITLSDSFCVDRFRDEFIELMRTGALDIVFANRHEVLSLYQTSDFETAVGCLRARRRARGRHDERGRLDGRVARQARARVPAAKVERIVDLTGAGDLYAAGFLYGLARGYPHEVCGRLGSLAAAEVICHVGARPQ